MTAAATIPRIFKSRLSSAALNCAAQLPFRLRTILNFTKVKLFDIYRRGAALENGPIQARLRTGMAKDFRVTGQRRRDALRLWAARRLRSRPL